MTWFLRKSLRFGPLRLNLSKRGLGASVGVKGARIGVDATGKPYAAGGRYGLYFRQQLGGAVRRQGPDALPPAPTPQVPMRAPVESPQRRGDWRPITIVLAVLLALVLCLIVGIVLGELIAYAGTETLVETLRYEGAPHGLSAVVDPGTGRVDFSDTRGWRTGWRPYDVDPLQVGGGQHGPTR